MLNFAVGPVMMAPEILDIGATQIPYFRTEEFSNIIKDNERLIQKIVHAEEYARTIFLTSSGTGAMESTILNTLSCEDRVLIINGGSFGQRFVELCKIYKVPYEEIKLNYGEPLFKETLQCYDKKGFTALLVNLCETSTGVYYDIHMLSEFCLANNMFLIVDAISSFLADPIDMAELGIDVLIIGSQKALAVSPGVGIVILNQVAINRIEIKKVQSMYFDFKLYLKDGLRGQTPFTPAVGILLQLNKRLNMIEEKGGGGVETEKIKEQATYFRNKIKCLPLKITTTSLSNCVTPLTPTNYVSAYHIFEILMKEYQIYVCPNGGELKDYLFRVGHIGNISHEDINQLVKAFKDMERRGIL